MEKLKQDNHYLTPGILANAGWQKVGTIGFCKKIEHVKMYISTYEGININVYDVNRINPLHILTLDVITVVDFNTFLDIIKLENFKI